MAKKRLIILLIILAVLAIIFFPGFSRIQQLKARNRLLEERIGTLEDENKKFQEEAKGLIDDLHYIEKTAREKMGLVKDGEIVYKVVTEEKKK
ncbi:septum formation initiator family protein [Candidatus Omnitrophota bacterium]